MIRLRDDLRSDLYGHFSHYPRIHWKADTLELLTHLPLEDDERHAVLLDLHTGSDVEGSEEIFTQAGLPSRRTS